MPKKQTVNGCNLAESLEWGSAVTNLRNVIYDEVKKQLANDFNFQAEIIRRFYHDQEFSWVCGMCGTIRVTVTGEKDIIAELEESEYCNACREAERNLSEWESGQMENNDRMMVEAFEEGRF